VCCSLVRIRKRPEFVSVEIQDHHNAGRDEPDDQMWSMQQIDEDKQEQGAQE
jgi:hypothetical protein